MSTTFTIVGNLTDDPRFYKAKGKKQAMAFFTVAVNTRWGEDEDEERNDFFDVSAFGYLAENIAESFNKGERVIVTGGLSTERVEMEIDGEDTSRTFIRMRARNVGHDLTFGTTEYEQTVKGKSKSKKDEDDDEEDEKPKKGKKGKKSKKDDSKKSKGKSKSKSKKKDDDEEDDDF